jgi:uncharacterized membrane protein YqjE
MATNNYTNNNYTNPRRYQREPSIGELISDLSSNASLLVRQEMQLAKVEMSHKVSQAGRELTLIGVGGLLGNAALLALTAALILGLATWMPLWAAALVVGIGLAVIAGLLIWSGVESLKNIDPIPTQTVNSLEESKEWLTEQMN